MIHVGRSHDVFKKNEFEEIESDEEEKKCKISLENIRKVKRLSRIFENNQHESFLGWIKERGYQF